MSDWVAELKAAKRITHCEWNMFFATLGHNVCDGHAGHLKRYEHYILVNNLFKLNDRAVRQAEENYEHMKDVKTITACMKKVKNTTDYPLTADEIEECDDLDSIKRKGKGFIKKYHHFSYVKSGVIKCQHVRGKGEYNTHHLFHLKVIK